MAASNDTYLLDERDYLISARNLAVFGEYSIWGGQPAFRTPGYTIFLAALKIIGGGFTLHVQIAQVLLGFFSGLMLFSIAKRVVAPKYALFASAIYWFYPTLVIYRFLVYSETLYLFVLLLVIWSLWKKHDQIRIGDTLLGGGFLGILILIRAEWTIWAAFLILWFWWKQGWKPASILAAVVLIVLSPWLIRNTMRYGKPIMTTMVGYNLWMGNSPQATGSGVVDDRHDLELSRVLNEVNSRIPAARDAERSAEFIRHASDYIINHPGKTISLIPAKLGFLWAAETRILEWSYYRGRVHWPPVLQNLLHFIFSIIWPSLLILIFLFWLRIQVAPLDFLYAIPIISSVTISIFTGEDRYHLAFLPVVILAFVRSMSDFKEQNIIRITWLRAGLCILGIAFVIWSTFRTKSFYDAMRDNFHSAATISVNHLRN